MLNCVVLIFCAFTVVVQADEEWRIVNITQGLVRGRIDPSGGLYNFYNIPYATAPTGINKFKAPLPPPVWSSTLDAVNRGIVCPQPFRSNAPEDCLVVNVFVPDTEATNLPVLVNIHGGAYQFGDGLSEQFKDLVRTKRVLAVSFNYRLGVHGFLCLGTEGAPGNAGIKDQVAALRWINANIARFGGNPDDVTLSACSAGSGSIDVLTHSSITTGLFNKAIMSSGVSTGAVGVQIDPIENAKGYAQVLNFNDVDDLNSLEEFYKNATVEQLTSRFDQILNNRDVNLRFGPCVERDIGQERVITDAPMSALNNGNYTKIPLLYGFTNMEGMMRLPFFDIWKGPMNVDFSDFLPAELYFESRDVQQRIGQRVKEFYFGNDPVSEDNILSYIMFHTDVLFGYPMLKLLTNRVKALGDTIYLYEYSFVEEGTPSLPHTNVTGADHCYQHIAVTDENTTNRTEEYKRMKEIMRDYWLNFILTGSPSKNDSVLPLWPPANAERSPHMLLGPAIELRNDILEHRAAFWDSIYEEYYRGPVLLPPIDVTDGAVTIMISNVMFVAVLLSLYFTM